MNLRDITPVILTYNEEANIGRTLEALAWAQQVVVLDSGSTDRTKELCNGFANVEWGERPFDHFAGQWNFARSLVDTPWMMALDADYLVTAELVQEVEQTDQTGVDAYQIPFRYCIGGRALRASLLPPRVTLFRPDRTEVVVDGHTQEMRVDGRVVELSGTIWHDDRKPFDRWWSNQKKYAAQEADKLASCGWRNLSPQDRLRKYTPLSPLAVIFWCLAFKGLAFEVPGGWIYTWQRFLAEALLLRDRAKSWITL